MAGQTEETQQADVVGDGDRAERVGIDRRRFVGMSIGASLSLTAGCIGAAIEGGTTTREQQSTSVPTTSKTEPPTSVPTTTSPYRTRLDGDTFEQLTGLEAVEGELTANTKYNITGSQCVELHDPGSDGAWLHIPLREPVDFSNARISCYLSTNGPGATKLPYVFLWDVDGNGFLLRAIVRSDERLVRTDFGILGPQDDDAPIDLTQIEQVSFRIGPTDKSGMQNVYFDYPTRVKVPNTPTVVFMFDDGNETDYTEGFPYLSQYDYPAVSYINTDIIGDEGRLSEEQVAELTSGGWLVGSHTASHENLSELGDTAAIRRQVSTAKEWLMERGYTEGAQHFCYPYGGVDQQALEVVSQFHRTGRVGGIQPIALPSNPQLIPAEGEPDLSEVNALLNQAIEFGGVVSLFFHSIDEEYRPEFQRIVDEVHRRDRADELQVVRLDELEAMAADAIMAE